MYKAIRYIGSKQKVLPFLEEHLLCRLKEGDSFFEGFLGTGIVSQYIAEKQKSIVISAGDISQYSEILLKIMNVGSHFSKKEILDLIKEFETSSLKKMLSGDIFNEFSNNGKPFSFEESRNFYHENSGKLIDTFKFFVKNKIDKKQITVEQAQILMFFILAYACKAGNTTSVFGAYLKSQAKFINFDKKFVETILNDLEVFLNQKNNFNFYLGSIIDNLKIIPKQTMIYLDPPYSTRRYESNYHILNYIVDFYFKAQDIKENSKTAQPKKMLDNPFGSKKETSRIFSQMIVQGIEKCEILAISYNTDGIITQQWIEDFCKINELNLETKTLSYKRFKSKQEVKNESKLEEILWIITK